MTALSHGRRWTLVLLAAALTFALSLASSIVPGPASAAPARSKVTLSIAKKKVDSGTTVRMSGKVTRGRKAASKASVRIQYRVGAKKAWRTLKTVRTDRKGRFSHTVKAKKSLQYRAVVVRSKKLAASSSKTRKLTVVPPLTVTAASQGDQVVGGEAVVVSGTLPKSYRGKAVTIERATTSFGRTSWTLLSNTTKVDAKGGFRFVGEPGVVWGHSAPDTLQVRVTLAAHKGMAKTSRTVTRPVWRWYEVTREAPLVSKVGERIKVSTAYDGGTNHYASIQGDFRYAGTYEEPTSTAIEHQITYDLKGRCSQLRTRTRVYSEGTTGAGKVRFRLAVDGVDKHVKERTVVAGQAEDLVVPLTTASKLVTFAMRPTEVIERGPQFNGWYYTPEVLCSAKPSAS